MSQVDVGTSIVDYVAEHVADVRPSLEIYLLLRKQQHLAIRVAP
jgi:hypothetical protein